MAKNPMPVKPGGRMLLEKLKNIITIPKTSNKRATTFFIVIFMFYSFD
jgi:hypothetical protein